MSLKERITVDTKLAMKARDHEVVSALRMISAKVLEKEVELRREKGRDYKLNDEETIAVVSAYAKQRRQSIDSYREAGRDELVTKEQHELDIVQKYLPRQLSESEIQKIVEEAIQETSASGPQAMGQVMRTVMPKLKGAADGKTVNAIVKQKLSDCE
jgi:uncharacterized protein YqeY